MIVKAAVKHGGGGLGEDFIASGLCSKLNLYRQVEVLLPQKSPPSGWMEKMGRGLEV